MTALAPLAAVALAAWWTAPPIAEATALLPGDLAAGEAVWLVEIGVSSTASATPTPAPAGLLAGLPLASPALPPDVATASPTLLASDRGWIGEPGDAALPNAIYPARLLEPPVLEQALPILPEESRRAAFSVGEIRLANGDGELDGLAGNWSLGGRAVQVLRGPHTRPLHAAYSSMVAVARLRASGAASGTTRLTVPLTDAAAALTVPLSEVYGGTGGADGVASLAGQPKPRLYGLRRQIAPDRKSVV